MALSGPDEGKGALWSQEGEILVSRSQMPKSEGVSPALTFWYCPTTFRTNPDSIHPPPFPLALLCSQHSLMPLAEPSWSMVEVQRLTYPGVSFLEIPFFRFFPCGLFLPPACSFPSVFLPLLWAACSRPHAIYHCWHSC